MHAERHSPALDDVSAGASDQEFRDFSYIVSHDLAGSLRHMTEFSRLLVGEFDGTLTGRQQVYADHIRAASTRCQGMIEQLLVFSRVQQKPLERVRQDATPTLQHALVRLSETAQKAGAAISVEPLGEVCADAGLLALALRHLLDNAIKFHQPKVRPRITVRAAHDETAWRVRISDNGVGVEPGLRDFAFRMFQRLHPDDGLPGVGAGLAICRRIARRHGGEVRFLDREAGSCVELALPNREAAA